MYKYRGIELNNEQSKAVDAALEGNSLILQAPAGSGKTLTLLVFARKTNNKGFNITFSKNSTIAAQKKFPKNSTICKTGHALAFGKEGYKYKDRLTKLTGRQLTKILPLGSPGIYNTENNKAYQIIETIRHFCYSADKEIQPYHVPTPISTATKYVIEESKKELAEISSQLWQRMIHPAETIPITHDVYLKIWALSKPNLSKDFILFDESQDANPVMLDVILSQKKSQIIFAGDRFQQIYSWRGAVNAMQKVNFQIHEICQSFRFGQPIADLANRIINSYSDPINHIKPILGTDKECEIITEKKGIVPNCIICRTNAGLVSETIKALSHKFKVFIQGGAQPLISLIEGIEALQRGRKSYHHELKLFQNYDEFVEYAESPQGGGLKAILNMIKKHSFEDLLSYLYQTQDKLTSESITITTTHKAKGLEWKVVKLSDDFKFPRDNTEVISQEETNILYVAVTRAQEKLLIYDCGALDDESFRNGKDYWDIITTNKREELV
jgi:superfamily I DNA/RNA helicase